MYVFKREEREKTSTFVEDSQNLMDGGTLSRTKCDLTAKFNDIYFQAIHFQTCSGFVLLTGLSSAQCLKPGESLLVMSVIGGCLQLV